MLNEYIDFSHITDTTTQAKANKLQIKVNNKLYKNIIIRYVKRLKSQDNKLW